jgi:PAS domain S-box-containing protein
MSGFSHEWLCRKIVDGAPDAMVFADGAGIIRLWNSGAEAIFGYGESEAIGQSLDLIIPEKLRKRHWEGYQKVIESGVSRYSRELLAVPAMRKDGERISVEFSIVLVRSPEGNVAGTAAVMRDVTARWQREKAHLEQLRQAPPAAAEAQ